MCKAKKTTQNCSEHT